MPGRMSCAASDSMYWTNAAASGPDSDLVVRSVRNIMKGRAQIGKTVSPGWLSSETPEKSSDGAAGQPLPDWKSADAAADTSAVCEVTQKPFAFWMVTSRRPSSMPFPASEYPMVHGLLEMKFTIPLLEETPTMLAANVPAAPDAGIVLPDPRFQSGHVAERYSDTIAFVPDEESRKMGTTGWLGSTTP
eukprot:349945-Chlamydomonas_euryale.AAC.1